MPICGILIRILSMSSVLKPHVASAIHQGLAVDCDPTRREQSDRPICAASIHIIWLTDMTWVSRLSRATTHQCMLPVSLLGLTSICPCEWGHVWLTCCCFRSKVQLLFASPANVFLESVAQWRYSAPSGNKCMLVRYRAVTA